MAKEINLKVNVEGGDDVENLNDGLKDTNKLTEAAGSKFGVLGNMMGKLKSGFSILKSGFSSMRAGIASTGIGALLIAFGALTSYFTKTKEGAAFLERGMAILGVVMSKITDLASSLGKTLFSAFTNPKEAILGIGTAIKDFVLRRFEEVLSGVKGLGTAFVKLFKGDFSGALESAKDAAIDLTTGLVPVAGLIKDNADAMGEFAGEVSNAVKETDKLTLASQKLYDLETAALVQDAKRKKAIAENLLIANDATAATEKRIKALEAANNLEESIARDAIARQRENVRILEETQALGENTREDDRALQEEKAKLIQIETDLFNKQKTNVAKLSGLKKKAAADEKKIEDDRIAEEKAAADEAVRIKKEEEDRKLEAYKKALEKGLAIQDEINLSEREQAVKKIKDDTDAKLIALEEAGLLTNELNIKLESDRLAQIDAIDKSYEEIQRQRRIDSRNDQLNNYQAYIGKVGEFNNVLTQISQNRYNNEKAQLVDKANSELQINGKVSRSTQGMLDQLDKDQEKRNKRQFKINKALKITEATITGVQSVLNAYNSGLEAGGPYGPLVGAAYAAGAGIFSAAKIAEIASTKYQSSRGGGGGSIKQPEKINIGSIVSSAAASGGAFGSNSTASTGKLDSKTLFNKQELYGVGGETVGNQNTIKVAVLESDITDTQNKVSTIESSAEFGG